MKQYVDKKRTKMKFEVGEEKYLRLRHPHWKSLTQGRVTKPSPRYFEPFPITDKVGRVAYRLQLLAKTHIHPMFHISLLKKSIGGQLLSPALPSLPKGIDQVVEPKAILEKRVIQCG